MENYKITCSPFASLVENEEFKTDAPSGHGLTIAFVEINYKIGGG
jgi:hypothetical protein